MGDGTRNYIKRIGLDGRAEDENGRIREKNGASKMANLAREYPELKVFTPSATLTGVKNRYGLQSLDQVRKLGRSKNK
jgi:hypothetical protein